jgi:hypothetical protein
VVEVRAVVRPTKRIIRTPTPEGEPPPIQRSFTKGRYTAEPSADGTEAAVPESAVVPEAPAVSKYDARPMASAPLADRLEPPPVWVDEPPETPAPRSRDEIEVVVDLRDTPTGFEGTFTQTDPGTAPPRTPKP